MHKLIDCETTGLDGEIVEIAAITIDDELNIISTDEDLVCPTSPIQFGAMAVHNITDEMVVGKPAMQEVSDKYKMETGYFIAHNAKFDLGMMPEGVISGDVKVFDTLALARELYPKPQVESHKLGVLFYTFGLYRDFEYTGTAHRALYDVYMTLAVLKHMLTENNLTLDTAYTLIQPKPAYKKPCWTKKWRGKGVTWEQLLVTDRGYLVWMFNNFDWDSMNNDHVELQEWMEEVL